MASEDATWGVDEFTVPDECTLAVAEDAGEYHQTEGELEAAFIAQLGRQGYERLPNVHQEKDLIGNLRHQLEELNEYTFTEREWRQFCRDYLLRDGKEEAREKANRVQNDEVYAMTRDDGTTKNIRILDKDRPQRNRLQVINQYVEAHGEKRSRYDVTILVNGLPLVHVELKRRGVPLEEAFEQMERYRRRSFGEGEGLFEYVQVFVISNGTDTRYYSPSFRSQAKGRARERGGFKFAMHWADGRNRIITSLEKFTATFFKRENLLNLILRYCVLTVEGDLLAMRPYQIAAAERILSRISDAQKQNRAGTRGAGGYVWHTTGSGKTLTSFKVAQLASRMEGIDKVLFVVDRKDLDYQTIREYDRFERGAADGNTSTKILKRQLGDASKRIIITTIQKLDIFIRENKDHAVLDMHVVLIFDECHRSQFGKMHRSIVRSFKCYYLFGFTGTPILAVNAVGEARQTTESLFGKQLHAYTIVDAIRDGNVLPFRVDYVRTMSAKKGIQDKQVASIDVDSALLAPVRIQGIVGYVLGNFNRHTHRLDTSGLEENRAKGFNSIMAVDSIAMAAAYYREFKRQQALVPQERRLTVATIFSNGLNEGELDGLLPEETFSTGSLESTARDCLAEAMEDYNAEFATAYTVSDGSFQSYYQDVSRRMQQREIDLLIVVNMFLTGFDARTLNTIWVDKSLRMHGLIQAYSRTNRICNAVKTYGNVVCFRNLEKATNEAIALFGNKDACGLALLPSYNDYYKGYKDEKGKHQPGYVELVKKLKKGFPKNEPIKGKENEDEFVRLWSTILRRRNVLVVFDEFEGDTLLSPREVQDYQGIYLGLYHKLLTEQGKPESIREDLTFEIELVRQTDINLEYILRLVEETVLSEKRGDLSTRFDEVWAAFKASMSLRSKQELIERFIGYYSSHPSGDVLESWQGFVTEQVQEDLNTIICQEKLDNEKTLQLMFGALRSEKLQKVGREWSDILPANLSYLDESYKTTKQRVVSKLSAFFDCYVGLKEAITGMKNLYESLKSRVANP